MFWREEAEDVTVILFQFFCRFFRGHLPPRQGVQRLGVSILL
ncbi:hypothetical protein P186_1002 [Pyrobaculum ferrireducens]|uniref:Uncharacterized protein n=1 Tax=Pyrobaculum ferrireducens TaxID=1104324 RepID=G7VBL1_9CREN|nr:hypothetical protein P186_1002 [Pyrobaculum ferrireducens]